MTLADLKVLVEESTRKLLQTGTPPVRFWILADVLKKDLNDPPVRRVLEELAVYPPKLRLLSTLREDGTWPIPKHKKDEEDAGPGPPIGWTFITMLRNLQVLGDYYATRDDGHIGATIEKILGWQCSEGHIPGPFSAEIPSPYYASFTLRNMLQYGMDGDPRIRKLERWILDKQRPDGGWSIPFVQDMRYRHPYKSMKMQEFVDIVESENRPPYDPNEYVDIPSCIWTTVMAVRALSWSKRLAKTEAAKRGAEFFLDRFFQRNYHPSYYQSEKNWTTLKYPTYYGSGIVALDILSYMGYDLRDERMERAIQWLVSARSGDGIWHVSDKPNLKKDLMASEVAVTVLNRML
ncbi:MAG: terpene cyclase/mutase family protein [Thermoplasmata archaeon]|nr:terpene cyclase/mutase family protein [Thermoplasmata archaeon]